MSKHVPITTRGVRSPRTRARASIVAVASLALTATAVSVATPAQAVAPENDTWQSATPVSGVPFTDTVDTTEATPDPGMGSYRFHGIWYRLRLPRDGKVYLTLRGSEFSPQVLRVYHAAKATDAPKDWSIVASDRTYSASDYARFATNVEGGTRYYVFVGTDSDGTGGPATLTIRRPAAVTYTLAATGKFAKVDGSAILNGTVKTTRPARVTLRTGLRQAVAGQVVQGYGYRQVDAAPTAQPWTMRVQARRSFKPGAARIVNDSIRVYDDGVPVGTFRFVRRIVTLK
jgi:hypothetical protein